MLPIMATDRYPTHRFVHFQVFRRFLFLVLNRFFSFWPPQIQSFLWGCPSRDSITAQLLPGHSPTPPPPFSTSVALGGVPREATYWLISIFASASQETQLGMSLTTPPFKLEAHLNKINCSQSLEQAASSQLSGLLRTFCVCHSKQYLARSKCPLNSCCCCCFWMNIHP